MAEKTIQHQQRSLGFSIADPVVSKRIDIQIDVEPVNGEPNTWRLDHPVSDDREQRQVYRTAVPVAGGAVCAQTHLDRQPLEFQKPAERI